MTTVDWLQTPTERNPGGAREFVIESTTAAGTNRPVTGAFWQPTVANKQANVQAGRETAQNAPQDAPQNAPIVLLGHGASGDRFQAPLPHLARRFCQEFGFAVLAIDGPVHGLRQVGDGGRGAFAVEMQRPGYIDDMVADWQLAYRSICQDQSLQPSALGYFGLSMGTIFGVPLLASALEFTVATIGLCGVSGAAAGIGQRLASDAAQVHHPILFLMQLEDELFDRAGCLSLFDALASTDKRLHANPGLHPLVPAEEISHSVDIIVARLLGKTVAPTVDIIAD